MQVRAAIEGWVRTRAGWGALKDLKKALDEVARYNILSAAQVGVNCTRVRSPLSTAGSEYNDMRV